MTSRSKITLLSIAETLGLSKTTVSLCLSENHRKYKIADATVNRVREFAQKAGYVPNFQARDLKKRQVPAIGLMICQDTSSDKSAEAINYAMRRITENNRRFIVYSFLPEEKHLAIANLKSMGIENIIIFASLIESTKYRGITGALKKQYENDLQRCVPLLDNINLYAIDYDFPANDGFILPNTYRLGISRCDIYLRLTRALIQSGKAPIAVQSKEFLNQYSTLPQKELAQINSQLVELTMPNPLFSNVFTLGGELRDQVKAAMKSHQVKSVMLGDDKLATGLIQAMLDDGYDIPKDLAVIGFDNIDSASYFRVPLTTIELPVMSNTILALDSILDGKEIPKVLEQKAKIIERQSAVFAGERQK